MDDKQIMLLILVGTPLFAWFINWVTRPFFKRMDEKRHRISRRLMW